MGMTLLDVGKPADTTTKKHHTGLIAVLAVVAVALLAAGASLIVDRQTEQPLSAEEQQAAIMQVITAHRDALEAGDRDATLATLTDDATAVFLSSPIGPPWVVSRVEYFQGSNGDRLSFFDDPAFFGNPPQVSIPTRAEYPYSYENGDPPPETARVGTSIFTMREVDGQWKIASIVRNVSYAF
jgi:type II secretory pathway pseudopilin PulG